MNKELIWLVVVVLLFASGFGSGAWMAGSIALHAQRGAEKGAAAEIAKLKPQTTIVNAKIVERITTEKVYQECRHSPEAFQTLQGAYK